MNWKVQPIGSFCQTGSGGTPHRERGADFYSGNIHWIKSGELRENVITGSEEFITELALKSSSAKLVPAGALLIAMYGATVGRVAILGMEAATNQAVCHLVPDLRVADPRYLFHVLQAKLPHFISRGVGGAQPNISQQIIRETQVMLPPLEEQRRIAAILDQAEALRTKRRQALAKLDTLTQSLFLEMFGDPRTNSKKLRAATIGKLLTLKSGNFLPASQMSATGRYPVYGGNGINGCHDEYMFEEPVISIGRVGAYCGAVHLTKPKAWITDNSLLVAQSDPLVSRRYLFEALKIANLNQYSSQSGQPLISSSRLQSVQLLVPAIDEQARFETQVNRIEKFEDRTITHLARLDQLFAGLERRAFEGEL